MTMTARPAWLPDEARQHDRFTIDVTIGVDGPGQSQAATLVDLSSAGCRLRVAERLSLGAFVTVRLTETCDVKGWVAWSRGLKAGVDFAACLPDAVVEDVTRTAG